MIHLVAAGSTTGRAHLLAERPNQDAFRALTGSWGSVAVVCDGCGGEPHSGVGAALGASLAARSAARQLAQGLPLNLERLRAEILASLGMIAEASGIPVREHLLFTIVGAAMADGRATVFACGDGVVAIDGALRVLGPFPGNAPPYLAYSLESSDSRSGELGGAAVGFELLHEGPAEHVLLGTDGAAQAPLAHFWMETRWFRNPDLLRRRLKLSRPEDDATVAIMRRGP